MVTTPTEGFDMKMPCTLLLCCLALAPSLHAEE